MGSIAVIPARSGSKRIPNKNIRLFEGRPIIAYAIETCLASGCFDEVMVSTNDQEIASIARSLGARVPFMRSEETATDKASTVSVLLEVLACYKQRGIHWNQLGCVYPCTPLLQPRQLQDAMSLLPSADAVMAVAAYDVPPEWALTMSNGRLTAKDPSQLSRRSQDIPTQYFDTGSFYLIDTAVLCRTMTLLPAHTIGFMLDPLSYQDIDNLDDWEMARLKWKARHV